MIEHTFNEIITFKIREERVAKISQFQRQRSNLMKDSELIVHQVRACIDVFYCKNSFFTTLARYWLDSSAAFSALASFV
jgi:hypothetical protein